MVEIWVTECGATSLGPLALSSWQGHGTGDTVRDGGDTSWIHSV